MAHILVVDDEPHIIELIQFNLELDNNTVDVAYDGKEAMNKIISAKFDLIILDVMIPFVDGFGVLKFTKKNKLNENTPVLMLTAKTAENDKIIGLEGGADDYVIKPFSVRELIARVHVLLRRNNNIDSGKSKEEKVIEVRKLVLDKSEHVVKVDGHEIELTLKEYDILKMLMDNFNKVVDRDDILNEVWGEGYFGDSRTIDVHIRHIRKKISEFDSELKYIETIRGVGYKIRK